MIYQDQEVTGKIIGSAIEVHRNFGPGLLESAYSFGLCYELKKVGLKFKHELVVPLVYKTEKSEYGFRADFLIEDKVILELKSVEKLFPTHEAQLLTYLRLMNKQVGLLINFNEVVLKNGIKRCVLGAKDFLSRTKSIKLPCNFLFSPRKKPISSLRLSTSIFPLRLPFYQPVKPTASNKFL